MLYVITITLENICEGKEDTKLYQRFLNQLVVQRNNYQN